MNADYDLFDKSEWRVYLISGAIRMNRPSVVKWMFHNGWFDYVTAEKCARVGLVEVILWMWIQRFPFCEVNQAGYDPTIRKYFSCWQDIWSLNTTAITDHYSDYSSNKKLFIIKVSGRSWETENHVLRQEFWDDDEYNYNFELVWKGMGFKVGHC
jgi:hypothetical protein